MSSEGSPPKKIDFVADSQTLQELAADGVLVAQLFLRLASTAQELDDGDGHVLAATWVKQRQQEKRSGTIENARKLGGILKGYLEGDNHNLQFWAVNYRLANKIRLEWVRLAAGEHGYARLFL